MYMYRSRQGKTVCTYIHTVLYKYTHTYTYQYICIHLIERQRVTGAARCSCSWKSITADAKHTSPCHSLSLYQRDTSFYFKLCSTPI